MAEIWVFEIFGYPQILKISNADFSATRGRNSKIFGGFIFLTWGHPWAKLEQFWWRSGVKPPDLSRNAPIVSFSPLLLPYLFSDGEEESDGTGGHPKRLSTSKTQISAPIVDSSSSSTSSANNGNGKPFYNHSGVLPIGDNFDDPNASQVLGHSYISYHSNKVLFVLVFVAPRLWKHDGITYVYLELGFGTVLTDGPI